jgi:LysM repeat protein
MYRRAVGALAPVAALIGMLALAGCGDDDAGATLPSFTIAPESYVTRAPATTTTTIPLEETEPGSTAAQEQLYEVQSGDYLALIAERYEVPIDEIVSYNDWSEGVGHVLHEGDTVRIPPGAIVPGGDDGTSTTPLAGDDIVDTTDPDDDTTEQTTGDNCGPGTYEIEPGDFPLAVAEKFDVTLDALNQANAGTAGYSTFYEGLEIIIPAKSNCN